MRRFWLYEKSHNLHYRVLKNPKATKALIFIHGMGGTASYWSDEYKKLYKDYSLYFIDLLGFGYSAKPEGEYTLNMHLEALHDFVNEDVDEEELTFVGHSMGSIIALGYAAKYPWHVKKVIALGLGYYLSEEQARSIMHETHSLSGILDDSPAGKLACSLVCAFRPWFLAVVPHLMKEFPKKVVQEALLHTHKSYFGTLQHVLYGQDIPSLIKKIPHSKLQFIHGTNDKTVPYSNIEELKKLYNIPVEKLANADHDFPLFNARKTATVIKKYLGN